MKKIMAALRWVGELIGFLRPVVPVGDAIARAILEATKEALPVVEWIATQTAAGWDDAIVRIFKEHAIPGAELFLALPPEARWHAVLEIASRLVHRKLPMLPLFVINAAVDVALAHVRGRVDPEAVLAAGPRFPVADSLARGIASQTGR